MGSWGAVVTAICCFTPILVLGLGIVGLGMLLTPYLDYLLLPALGLFLVLAIFGLWQKTVRVSSHARILRHSRKRLDALCPKNGQVCKPVPRITVETLIRPEHNHLLALLPYSFCDSPDCDVVYVSASGEQLITTSQLRFGSVLKRKRTRDRSVIALTLIERPFGMTIRFKGTTDIPNVIIQRIKARECRCQVTNPRGSYCLGDIYKAINWPEKL